MRVIEHIPGLRSLWQSLTPSHRRPAPRDPRPRFSLTGELSPGKRTLYAINGIDFQVDTNTWVVGELTCGASVSVCGVYRKGTERYATRITLNPRRT